jgi:hypothetical protein
VKATFPEFPASIFPTKGWSPYGVHLTKPKRLFKTLLERDTYFFGAQTINKFYLDIQNYYLPSAEKHI